MSAKVSNSSDPIPSIEQMSVLGNRWEHCFHSNFKDSRIGIGRGSVFNFPGWEKILSGIAKKILNLQSHNLGLNSESVK